MAKTDKLRLSVTVTRPRGRLLDTAHGAGRTGPPRRIRNDQGIDSHVMNRWMLSLNYVNQTDHSAGPVSSNGYGYVLSFFVLVLVLVIVIGFAFIFP